VIFGFYDREKFYAEIVTSREENPNKGEQISHIAKLAKPL
jgi:hypothetical protein